MSKCDLTITLDREPPHYAPGEKVSGKLTVGVNEPCRCDALTVDLLWRTHGKGNKDAGTPNHELLGTFDWTPGEMHEHAFSFTLPQGPVSYHGHIVNVDWYAEARADVPWAIDPKAQQDLLLLPLPARSEASAAYRAGPRRVAQPHVIGDRARKDSPKVKIFVVVVMLAFFLFFFGSQLVVDGSPNVILMGFFVVLLGFSAKILWSDVRNFAAKQKVGELKIETDPAEATRGESLRVRAWFVPRSEGRVKRVWATLQGEEVAISGSGTNRTTHRHPLGKVESEMCGAMAFVREQPIDLVCELRVPEDAAPSFRSGDNRVEWSVVVHVDIEGWPDLEQAVEIDVYPSR
jgi:hypothetical protein